LAVLSCILRQLLEDAEIPQPLTELYGKRGAKGQLHFPECQGLLADIVTRLGRVYLVIDALDECEPKHRREFLQAVNNLTQMHDIRLLVTSRPHTQDVAEMFQRHSTLKIEAQTEDIRTYLRQEIDRQGIGYRVDAEFIRETGPEAGRRGK